MGFFGRRGIRIATRLDLALSPFQILAQFCRQSLSALFGLLGFCHRLETFIGRECIFGWMTALLSAF
jgi:hypothetical protein